MSDSSKTVVREYFDEDALGYLDAYTQEHELRGQIFRERRDHVFELLQPPAGRVLDIGSGPGVFTARLLQQGAECWVVDLAPKMVEAARNALNGSNLTHRVRYSVADIEHLPFHAQSFDTVLCVGVLQYLSALGPALDELARVTRPGGQIIVACPNHHSPLNRLHRGVITMARFGRSALRWAGVEMKSNPVRLMFREDIPNGAFVAGVVEREAKQRGLRLQAMKYENLYFPFSMPGLQAPVRWWNRLGRRSMEAGRLTTWGRDIVMRFIRTS